MFNECAVCNITGNPRASRCLSANVGPSLDLAEHSLPSFLNAEGGGGDSITFFFLFFLFWGVACPYRAATSLLGNTDNKFCLAALYPSIYIISA